MSAVRARLVGHENVDWLDALDCAVAEPADISLCHPTAPRPPGFCVMFLDVRADSHLVFHPDAASYVGTIANAYAGTPQAVNEAIDWFRRGAPRPSRGLVYLGSLGTYPCPVSIGTAIDVGEQVIFGRGRQCDVILRHGAHSDQNVCARRHAVIKRTSDGLELIDLRSTNGTFVDGNLIPDGPARVQAGSEIAFAGYFRFLVCG